MDPDLARGGPAARLTHQEHAHGIGRLIRGVGLVHLVSTFRRAEVGQARAGNEKVCGILVVDRREQRDLAQIHGLTETLLRKPGQRLAGGQRLARQL